MKMRIASMVMVMLAVLLTGCTTNPYSGERQMAKSAKYGGFATVAGGVVGALVGGKDGALIGAGLGAAAGGGYGYYTDVQEMKLRQSLEQERMSVTRNADNSLTVSMPSDVAFDTGSAEIKTVNYQALNTIASTVKASNGAMRIVGHTDSTGSLELNQRLSENRAASVANYMLAQGIAYERITTEGQAYHNPVADNSTPTGRAKNRRVEIILQ